MTLFIFYLMIQHFYKIISSKTKEVTTTPLIYCRKDKHDFQISHETILCWELLASTLQRIYFHLLLWVQIDHFSKVHCVDLNEKIKCSLACRPIQVLSLPSLWAGNLLSFTSRWHTCSDSPRTHTHYIDKRAGQCNAGYLWLFWIRIKCHLYSHT